MSKLNKQFKKFEKKIIDFIKESPPKPNPLDIRIVKATIKKEKDSKHKDGRFRVQCIKDSDGIDGWIWCGMLVKDLFRGEDWVKILPKLKPLYFAMHGGWNSTLRVEVWYKKEWHIIWDAINDFESFAQSKKRTDDYNNFVNNEGLKIARMIDAGKTFKFIEEKLNQGHSGNTYAWSFSLGFSKAKNKENMLKVRKEYNIKNGGTGEEKGTLNPCIMSLEVEK